MSPVDDPSPSDSALNRETWKLTHQAESLDSQFYRDHPIAWWVTLVGPFLLTLLILGVIAEFRGTDFVWRLLTTAVATYLFLGKFVILGGAAVEPDSVASLMSRNELFAMVVYMDLVTACILASHLGFMFRLPVLGTKLSALVQDAQFILQSNRWMRHATFAGLVAFVMLPLAATGSIGASIFGRLLGLGRVATFCGIALGSFLGCAVVSLGAEFINRHFDRENPWLMMGGVAVLAGLILVLNSRYQKLKSRFVVTQTPEVASAAALSESDSLPSDRAS